MPRSSYATLALAVALAAGCTATYTRTANVADTLALKADEFAGASAGIQCVEPSAGCRSGTNFEAAHQFAQESHEFRQSLERRSDQEVVSSYKRLWHRYHTLLHEIDTARDPRLKSDFKPLQAAFVDVQSHVKTGYSHADPDLYASGGYKYDPYYN